MPRARNDLAGKTNHMLTYVQPIRYSTTYGWEWEAECACGRKTREFAGYFKRKKSCGCLSPRYKNPNQQGDRK